MSLYYKYVNIDKHESVDGGEFLGGVKFGPVSSGLLPHLLVFLLRDDIERKSPMVPLEGSWAGDRIVVASDGRMGKHYEVEGDRPYRDITLAVVKEVYAKGYWQQRMVEGYIRDQRHMIKHYGDTEGGVWAQAHLIEEITPLLDEITRLGGEQKEDGT